MTRVNRPFGSPKRVPLAQVEEVLGLYRERYFDLNVQHFHEKLKQEHHLQLSYTWVKQALQGAGLVKRGRKLATDTPSVSQNESLTLGKTRRGHRYSHSG